MLKDLISIIIPAYNSAKFIKETIQSVIDQTFKEWELIIIDDGSTDNTKELIQTYLKDERIRYYFQKNSGVSMARNKGIELSKGNYIAFLDADDLWLPDNLQEKIKILSNDNTDWVFSDAYLLYENNKLNLALEGTDISILEHYLLWDKPVVPGPSSNIVLKKTCFNDGLKFDSSFSTAADQDFCFYLSANYRGKRIPKALFKYRQLQNSMSRNMYVVSNDHYRVYKKAEKNGLFKSFLFKMKCFSNMYFIIAGGWWVNADNKFKAIQYVTKAVVLYPPKISMLISKAIGKIT